jgi:outer membrane protein
MKSKINFILFLCVGLASAQAQQTYNLSAQEAVDLAVKNAFEVRELMQDYETQKWKNKEVSAATLPQVSATGQMSYYTNLPKIQFPDASAFNIYEILVNEGVKNGSGNPITNNATFNVNEVSFVAPFNMNVGLGINQLLFQPDIFVALKAKQGVLDLAKMRIDLADDMVKENVLKSYYSVLIAQKQQEVLASTRTRLQKLLGEMDQMYKNGFAEKLDVDRLQVTINNTNTAYDQLSGAIQISMTLLKNAMNIDPKSTVTLTEKLEIDALKAYMMVATPFDVAQRGEIKLLDKAIDLQNLDIQRHKLSKLPTVAAFYNLQRQGQKNDAFAAFTGNSWFWFTTGIVGLQVNQPIFDGFARKSRQKQSEIAIEKSRISREKAIMGLGLQHDIATTSLSNALLNLDAQERNLKLAQEVLNTTQTKFKAGVGSSFEVIQADTEVQRAQGAYFQALYDGYVQKINMEKALGKF